MGYIYLDKIQYKEQKKPINNHYQQFIYQSKYHFMNIWNSSIILIFLLLLIFPLFLNAQEPEVTTAKTITGNVLSVNGLTVSGATVNLLRQEDEVLVKAELTNEKGEYRFEQIRAGNYLLVLVHPDYAIYRTEPIVITGNLNYETIYLNERSVELDEVSITFQRCLMWTRAFPMPGIQPWKY